MNHTLMKRQGTERAYPLRKKVLFFLLTMVFSIVLIACAGFAEVLINNQIYSTPVMTLLHENYERISNHTALQLGDMIFIQEDQNKAAVYCEERNLVAVNIHKTDSDAQVFSWERDKSETGGADGKNLQAANEGMRDDADIRETVFLGVNSFGEITYFHNRYKAEKTWTLYTVEIDIAKTMDRHDAYAFASLWIRAGYALRYAIYPIGTAALILMFLCFFKLLKMAGHQVEGDVPEPIWETKIPFDLQTLIFIGVGVIYYTVALEISYYGVQMFRVAGDCLCILLLEAECIFWCVSLSIRIKTRRLWDQMLIYRLMKALGRGFRGLFGKNGKLYEVSGRAVGKDGTIWRASGRLFGREGFFRKLAGRILKIVIRPWKWFVRILKKAAGGGKTILAGLPLMRKTVLLLTALTLGEVVILSYAAGHDEFDILLVWWLIEKLLLYPVILLAVLQLRKLQEAGRALAAGNLSYQVDVSKMRCELKEHGENLNNIALGMNSAVEERLKSERFKTELITNVSHDIKTPLTSVINYADLIGREECENPKITEYAGILHRQSDRLKRLIEDLVEASKASTGNLEVFLAPCEANLFLNQADGEYEEKLAKANLTLITRQPSDTIRIMADGRRMWRIFDNLLNNICKYALSGTRVYLTLEQEGEEAVISFKNTSREPLDMDAEELMERFVRGDKSRNTEGNGLGLAIAKSLTELQNGRMQLATDGDLFKVVLRFPICK